MIVSGYASYSSFPSEPDHDIRVHLMESINNYLKRSENNCLLITEEMAHWYVAHFGGNFADLTHFMENVLIQKVGTKRGISFPKYDTIHRYI